VKKETIVQVFDWLSTDPEIFSLLLLVPKTATPIEPDPIEVDKRICKTRQVGDVTDNKPRLAIWGRNPKTLHGRWSQRELEIDILVPLQLQKSTGLALDLGNRIKDIMKTKRLGTRIVDIKIDPDLPTAFGWYKSAVRITYNYLG